MIALGGELGPFLCVFHVGIGGKGGCKVPIVGRGCLALITAGGYTPGRWSRGN